MLIFTNRTIASGKTDESAFTRAYLPGQTRLALASVAASGKSWSVTGIQADVDDPGAMEALLQVFRGSKPVLVYIHGNNNTPGRCFTRCARLEARYGVPVIGFSWASEGYLSDGSVLPGLDDGYADAGDEDNLEGVKPSNRTDESVQGRIQRYHQAKTNAQHSVDALARFLRMLGTARLYLNSQPFTLAAHSLGAHLLQYTLEVPGAGEALGTAHNVALLAPCTRAAGHSEWLARIRPKGQVFVTYNKGDLVLFGAWVADGMQGKLGADPTADVLRAPGVRYINFSNSGTGPGGHAYFVDKLVPAATKKLFRKLFACEPDLQPGEEPGKVYPLGCDPDGVTCYMGKPDSPPA